ncbi:Cys-tRNA(Pro) deacylase [Alteromonas pelagimontana]|uniref:Cys-tRNA(Pro)/Cys-tRNA(Cys) deacylase n=1 Tax=Alteromonas pelagimontana TaxID=1858656 RepID=A0A6M4M8J2_9ALTE|nr:Cys-tRNA(Pro) deacylase [Alteromonas pelagimontana]QJR79512.1 Cys-tRNA(Pro) deacylase [Alteromonas pelagimontana]
MTPAINLLKKRKLPFNVHKYEHDPDATSYGLEAANKLALPYAQVFKTLVVELDNKELAVAILPVDKRLNLKSMAKACGSKKAAMAAPDDVARSTGYVLGGVSPLGQKKALITRLDSSAELLSVIFVSAGRRGLEVSLSPQDMLALTRGKFAPLTQPED